MLLAFLSLFPREEITASLDVDTGCFVLMTVVVDAVVTGVLLDVLCDLKVVEDATLEGVIEEEGEEEGDEGEEGEEEEEEDEEDDGTDVVASKLPPTSSYSLSLPSTGLGPGTASLSITECHSESSFGP